MAQAIVEQRHEFNNYLAPLFRQIQLSVKMAGIPAGIFLCEGRFMGLLFPHHVFSLIKMAIS
jgi:hypothetical protein